MWTYPDTTTFKLESLIDPTSVWIPVTDATILRNMEDYELVDDGLTLKECYDQLSLMQILEM
ncbi:hypothetical protein HYP06_gp047 [Vibrio phage vB_VspP_pVa5]|uniref:Uncharacterized protein n=1 Tax=Vibrio phage vB_VspP_pVa5 TaxID=1913109 RepID=A0A1J0GVB2_9CAUD|nr:hypothetical protein HYP06_gp047 [Vibrio phage vB_VspP_pVa5]APC46116.1 hypothetical protein vBVspPpVa5_0047 [Vibrio phage vB_VspP_pVa5]